MRRDYLSMAVICLVLGIMISVQYKSNVISPSSPDRWAELTIQTNNLRNQHDALVNEKVSLTHQLADNNVEEQGRALREMFDNANIAAGLTPVTGPGIIVLLDDRPDSFQKHIDNFAIQNWNLLTVINELNSAGAEAISINNERILATSAVGLQGSEILVNLQPVSAPFEIKAIGNANTLESSLRLKGGEIEALLLCGIKVTIEKTEQVEIPAYSGNHLARNKFFSTQSCIKKFRS